MTSWWSPTAHSPKQGMDEHSSSHTRMDMITPHTSLLQQLHEYVDAYIVYLFDRASGATPEVITDLHQIIDELEALQKHRDQDAEAERLAQRIGDQLAHLRMLTLEPAQRRTLPSRPKQTLLDAFHAYFNQEIAYLARVEGAAQREQINLLLGDIIADLKALALHPTDEQALWLAADLKAKREQVKKLQRPWQQVHDISP